MVVDPARVDVVAEVLDWFESLSHGGVGARTVGLADIDPRRQRHPGPLRLYERIGFRPAGRDVVYVR